MPKKKKTEETVEISKTIWPKIVQGSHSTRIEHEDGRIEFTTDWEALKRDVQNALTEYENSVKVNTTETKPKRKKKNEA